MTYLVDFIILLTAFTKTTSSPDESLDSANVEMLLNKDLMHTRLPESLIDGRRSQWRGRGEPRILKVLHSFGMGS